MGIFTDLYEAKYKGGKGRRRGGIKGGQGVRSRDVEWEKEINGKYTNYEIKGMTLKDFPKKTNIHAYVMVTMKKDNRYPFSITKAIMAITGGNKKKTIFKKTTTGYTSMQDLDSGVVLMKRFIEGQLQKVGVIDSHGKIITTFYKGDSDKKKDPDIPKRGSKYKVVKEFRADSVYNPWKPGVIMTITKVSQANDSVTFKATHGGIPGKSSVEFYLSQFVSFVKDGSLKKV